MYSMRMKKYHVFANCICLVIGLVTLTIPVSGFAKAGAKSLFISIDDKDLPTANQSKPVIKPLKKTTQHKAQCIKKTG